MTIGASPTQCGNAPSAASGSSWTLATTATLDPGEVGVLRIALDNITATDGDNNEVASVTGGDGTWEKLGEYTNSQGAGAAGVTVATWLFTPSTSNTTGTVFTITLQSNRTQKIAALEKWTVGAGNSLRQTTEAAIITSQVDAGGGFGASTYSGLTSLERLYLRVLGAEMSTTASVAATADFTALSSFRSSTSSPISLLGEYRVNTSTDETSNPAFTPTADKAGLFFALEEYSVGGGGTPITGSANGNIGPITGSAAGALSISGNASGSIGAITGSASATLLISAAASGNIGAITGGATANLAIRGSATGGIGAITGAASGRVAIKASASGNIGAVTGGGTSRLSARASASGSIGAITGSATARLTVRASANGSIGAITGASSGSSSSAPQTVGAANGSIGRITGSASARLAIKANAGGSIGAITGLGSARLASRGSVAGSIGRITGSASARLTIRASASGSIGAVTGNAGGSSGAAPQIIGAGVGSIGRISGGAVAQLSITASGFGSIGAITGIARAGGGGTATVRFISFAVEAKPLTFVAEQKALVFVVDEDGDRRVRNMPNKIVSEVWKCGLDLTPWLAGGRTVTVLRHENVTGGVQVDQVSLDGADTGTFRLSGGNRKGTAQFDIVGDLSDGNTFGQRFQVTCI